MLSTIFHNSEDFSHNGEHRIHKSFHPKVVSSRFIFAHKREESFKMFSFLLTFLFGKKGTSKLKAEVIPTKKVFLIKFSLISLFRLRTTKNYWTSIRRCCSTPRSSHIKLQSRRVAKAKNWLVQRWRNAQNWAKLSPNVSSLGRFILP